MRIYVRPLTQKEADRCENAREPVCKCRCGGEKHGAGRVPSGDFSALPSDDPHYRPPVTKLQAKKMLRDAYAHIQMGPDYAQPNWHEALTIIGAALANSEAKCQTE